MIFPFAKNNKNLSSPIKYTTAIVIATVIAVSQLAACSPCFRTAYLFSGVEGIVTLNGKPQAGLKVIRQYQDGDSAKVEETAVTDANGHFRFPQGTRFDMICYAAEPYVEQKIIIHTDSKLVNGWSFVKRNYDNEGELEKPVSLDCELSSSEQRRKASLLSDVVGICSF